MFYIRTGHGRPKKTSDIQHDANALALAVILTLLVIGGVEVNPGPEFVDGHLPGPSFSNVTLMDIMEAIRLTQIQIGRISDKVNDLTTKFSNVSRGGEVPTAHPTTRTSTSDNLNPTTPSHSAVTEAEAPREPPTTVSPRAANREAQRAATPRGRRQRKVSATPEVGAVMLGCQNVWRIASAAREQFILGGQVVFRSIRGGTTRCALGALHGDVAACRALRADIVLHVGGNDLAHRSVEYPLECIAELINAAKRVSKVRNIFICSIPQDPTSSDYLTSQRRHFNDELERLCTGEGARFIDLRPRLCECSY